MVGELHSLTLPEACERLGELRAEIATLEATLVSLTAVETHPAVDAARSVLQKLRDVTAERNTARAEVVALDRENSTLRAERDEAREQAEKWFIQTPRTGYDELAPFTEQDYDVVLAKIKREAVEAFVWTVQQRAAETTTRSFELICEDELVKLRERVAISTDL